MKTLYRVYAQMMKVHWSILLEYRGDTFFYMVGSFIFPLVTLAVWMSVSENGAVGSYGQRDFVLYFLIVMFVSRLSGSWDAWEMETHMREGTLSSYLLRPSAYFHWRFSENLVYKLFYGVLMLVAWAIAWSLTDMVHIRLEPGFLAVAVLSVALAVMIRYMLFFCVGLLGFWTTRMLALASLIEGIGLFLSGRIAPYSLLPTWVQTTQDYTPFYWLLGFPVDLITEKIGGETIPYGLFMQSLWLIVFTALYLVLWKRGIRKYSAVGG